jgi:uncharacterized protein YndB with AHSA1/START domain
MTAADGILDTRGDTPVLRFERSYTHSIERVWAALTEPDKLEAWLARADVDLQVGGRVRLEWLNTNENGERYENAIAQGTVTQLAPPHLLEYDTDIHGVLRWQLEEVDGGTQVTFSASVALPEDQLSERLSGWHWHLDALADALDGERVDWPNWPRDRWQAIHERYLARVA